MSIHAKTQEKPLVVSVIPDIAFADFTCLPCGITFLGTWQQFSNPDQLSSGSFGIQ